MPPSILEGLQMGFAAGRSAQLKDLWLICFTLILWFVWHARNKMRHEGKVFSVENICRLISGHIQAASRLSIGTMHNSIQDLWILKSFGVECRSRCAPRVIEVNWHPPLMGWVKIISDGAGRMMRGLEGMKLYLEIIWGVFLELLLQV